MQHLIQLQIFLFASCNIKVLTENLYLQIVNKSIYFRKAQGMLAVFTRPPSHFKS